MADFNKTQGTWGRDANVSGTSKAWFSWSHSGNAFNRSYNMSSATDNGTGQYTFAFTVAMADTNYCVVLGSSRNGSSGNAANASDFHNLATGNFQIRTGNDGGSNVNHENVCASVFNST